MTTDSSPGDAAADAVRELVKGGYVAHSNAGGVPQIRVLAGPPETWGDLQPLARGLLEGLIDGLADARADTPPVYPEPGSTIPDQPGYVVGECGHRVAGCEWRAGFRTCERCPSPVGLAGIDVDIAAGGTHAFGDPFGPIGPAMPYERRRHLERILEFGWAYITGRTEAGWSMVISPRGQGVLADGRAGVHAEALRRVAAGAVHLGGDLMPAEPHDADEDIADWAAVERYVAAGRAYVHGPRDGLFGWPISFTPAPGVTPS